MQIKKGTPYYLLFLALVILTPFLEFLLHNIGTVNERTDLRINFLTIKRLSFFYIFFIIFFFSFVIYTKNKFHKYSSSTKRAFGVRTIGQTHLTVSVEPIVKRNFVKEAIT